MLASCKLQIIAGCTTQKLKFVIPMDMNSLFTNVLHRHKPTQLFSPLSNIPACRHPGNLLRTPEGKICILDFGLMTEVGLHKHNLAFTTFLPTKLDIVSLWSFGFLIDDMD